MPCMRSLCRLSCDGLWTAGSPLASSMNLAVLPLQDLLAFSFRTREISQVFVFCYAVSTMLSCCVCSMSMLRQAMQAVFTRHFSSCNRPERPEHKWSSYLQRQRLCTLSRTSFASNLYALYATGASTAHISRSQTSQVMPQSGPQKATHTGESGSDSFAAALRP